MVQRFALAAVLNVALIGAPAFAQAPAALVEVDAVINEQFTQTVPILGRLVTLHTGSVAARIGGAIKQVNVALGDRVVEGQVLARIDSQRLALTLAQSRAQMVESQARLQTVLAQQALANQAMQRLQGLTNSAVSQAAFDDAVQQQNIASARVNEAEAMLGSRRASLEIAKLELSYADIKAPFNGTITLKHTEVGDYVQVGTPVVQIISDQELELEADIPTRFLPGIAARIDTQKGDTNHIKIAVSLDDGSQHFAHLRAIIPAENPRTRTRTVRFNIELGDDADIAAWNVADGQSATLLVPISVPRNVLTVHKDAVIKKWQDNIVYRVVDDQAELVVIEIGNQVGERIEVVAGLAVNDQVVVRGNERLNPGQAVQTAP